MTKVCSRNVVEIFKYTYKAQIMFRSRIVCNIINFEQKCLFRNLKKYEKFFINCLNKIQNFVIFFTQSDVS